MQLGPQPIPLLHRHLQSGPVPRVILHHGGKVTMSHGHCLDSSSGHYPEGSGVVSASPISYPRMHHSSWMKATHKALPHCWGSWPVCQHYSHRCCRTQGVGRRSHYKEKKKRRAGRTDSRGASSVPMTSILSWHCQHATGTQLNSADSGQVPREAQARWQGDQVTPGEPLGN